MDKSETTKQILASLFFVGGIVLIVLFIFTIGQDKGFSQSKFQIDILYRNVGGVVEGAPVRLHGVNIGHISRIDFLDQPVRDRKVKVTINVFSKYKEQLAKGTRFGIQTEGVLGEKLIEIYTVEGDEPVDLSKPVIGDDPLSIGDMAQQFARLAESFTITADEFSKVDVVRLTDVIEESSRSLLETSKGLNEMMSDMKEITKKSKRMIDRLEQKIIDGDLFSVF